MRKMKVWTIGIAALTAGLLGAACGDDGGGTGGGGSGDVCADVACENVPTFSGGELPWDLCTSCHSDNGTVRQSNGVPDDSDYTSYDAVKGRAQLIAERVNSSGADVMPPSGSTQLTGADKTAFTKWGCCDAPQ